MSWSEFVARGPSQSRRMVGVDRERSIGRGVDPPVVFRVRGSCRCGPGFSRGPSQRRCRLLRRLLPRVPLLEPLEGRRVCHPVVGAQLLVLVRRSVGCGTILVVSRVFVVSAELPPQTSGRGTRSEVFLSVLRTAWDVLASLLLVLLRWFAGLWDDRRERNEEACDVVE